MKNVELRKLRKDPKNGPKEPQGLARTHFDERWVKLTWLNEERLRMYLL
jgi:hypothetical protein